MLIAKGFLMDNEDSYASARETFKILRWVILGVATMMLLPLLIHSGAFRILPILMVFWGLLAISQYKERSYKDPTMKPVERSPRAILVRPSPAGKFGVYDYDSLERLNSREYDTADSARHHMNLVYPMVYIYFS